MILAIIPARIGSKGVPQKNLRQIAGKPLVKWTIDAVQNSKLVDNSVLSSDDNHILTLARAKTTMHDRTPAFATDQASLESVVHDVLSSDDVFEQVEVILLLQPTSPIRTGEQIDAAIRQLWDDGADSLVSVVKTHSFIWQVSNGIAHSDYIFKARPRRQSIDAKWEENGSIYAFTKEHWEKHHNRLGGKVTLFEMPEETRIQIDTELDFQIVEKLLEREKVLVH